MIQTILWSLSSLLEYDHDAFRGFHTPSSPRNLDQLQKYTVKKRLVEALDDFPAVKPRSKRGL